MLISNKSRKHFKPCFLFNENQKTERGTLFYDIAPKDTKWSINLFSVVAVDVVVFLNFPVKASGNACFPYVLVVTEPPTRGERSILIFSCLKQNLDNYYTYILTKH